MVPLKRITPKINMSLSKILSTSDDRYYNTYLLIHLPICSLVRNLYLITTNEYYLFIQAYCYYHVIDVEIF